MDNIELNGVKLIINGYKINLQDIDFITFDNGINIYKSSSDIINFKIGLNHFIELGKKFYDSGIEQFVYLKGNKIINVENINKVYYNDSFLDVRTAKNSLKIYGLGKNEAKMLAEMYYSVPFITNYNLEK